MLENELSFKIDQLMKMIAFRRLKTIIYNILKDKIQSSVYILIKRPKF